MEIFNFFDNAHTAVNFIFFIIGVLILVKGSDLFIDSAVFFARKFHVSEVIIGLTLVSIGTSLPELAANINSALKCRSAIAVGNITGSNITNIALVVGISAFIIGKIKVPKKLFQRDMIFMILVTGLLLSFSYFFDTPIFRINRIEAGVMFTLFIFYIIYLFYFNKEDVQHEVSEYDDLKIKSIPMALLFLFIGMFFIFLGSEVMIRNVIIIAERLNISDGVIGATIVALGTSIPELAVTIAGIVKNKSDISLGNIVGSNIFNILGVLGITGLISNIDIINLATNSPDTTMLYWTMPITLIIALILFIFMAIKMELGRYKGLFLLLFYAGFIVFNFVEFSL